MKIALHQCAGVINDPAGALAVMAEQARAAAAAGAGLLLLSEMYWSGYNIGAENARRHAVTQAQLEPAGRIARANGIALAFGYPELVGDKVANSAALIGPDGGLLLNFRKAHLWGDVDRGMFQVAGDEFSVATLNGFKVGLLVCYDVEFPETPRLLALAGAQVILVPTALPNPFTQVSRVLIPTRAYENQVYVAYANHCGQADGLDYVGSSTICGPDGAVLALAGRNGEETLLADLDLAHLMAIRAGADQIYADRRPEIYGALAAAR